VTIDTPVNALYTSGMAAKQQDPSMEKVRALFKESELSLHELGVRMGFGEKIARQSAFQFLKTADQLSTIPPSWAPYVDSSFLAKMV